MKFFLERKKEYHDNVSLLLERKLTQISDDVTMMMMNLYYNIELRFFPLKLLREYLKNIYIFFFVSCNTYPYIEFESYLKILQLFGKKNIEREIVNGRND